MPKAAVKPRPTAKSIARREAILRHAVELFDARGYANTSLDDIAQAVGIKREALYYYYRNRSEILLAIIRPQNLALTKGLKQILRGRDSAADKLHRAIRNHLERFDRYCLEMTVSLRDGLTLESAHVRREMSRIFRRYERMWIALIAAGQKSGEFTTPGDAKMVTFAILGMCNWLARWYNPKKPVGIDELIATYFRLVGAGLFAGRRRNLRPRRK